MKARGRVEGKPDEGAGAAPEATGVARSNGRGDGAARVAAASAVRAFVAWLTTRKETVHAGALEPSDAMYRATIEFLRERGLECERYDPDWHGLLDDLLDDR